MQEDKEIDAYLSKGQLKSLNNGKPFQLKHHQLIEPTEKTDNHVKLQVNHNHFKKITKHMATGKGIRMTHEIIKGGAFLGKVGDFFKSIVNNDAVKKLAIKGATAVAKKVANKLKINPNVIDSVSNAIQGEGFPKGSQEAYAHTKIMRSAKNPKVSQTSKAHFTKGSPEAKAHMEKLRAMKGKGFFDDIVKGAKKLAGNKAVQGIAAKALKTGLSMTPIGKMVPSSVTNKLIDSGVGAGGNAVAGSGVYTITKNPYSTIKGGMVSNVYTNPRRVKALVGGSFREL